METSVVHEEARVPINERTTSSDQLPIYHSTQTCEMSGGPASVNALFGAMFPLGSAIYHPQPISTVQFQQGLDPQNVNEQINTNTNLHYGLPTNEHYSLDHVQTRANNDYDHNSVRSPIQNPSQMGFNYDSMIQYDPRTPLPPTAPAFSQAHEMNHMTENAYQQTLYWSHAPPYFSRDQAPIPSDSFDIQSQRFFQSLPNSSSIPCQLPNPQDFQRTLGHHYGEPNIQSFNDELSSAKRMKFCDKEPPTRQSCPSADTSFSSSTDESSTNDIHLIETSMSSCELLEPPNCSSSPTHVKESSFSASASAPPTGLLRTFSPVHENFLPVPGTPFKKRARSATTDVPPIAQPRSTSFPTGAATSILESVPVELGPSIQSTPNKITDLRPNLPPSVHPPGPLGKNPCAKLEPALLPLHSPPPKPNQQQSFKLNHDLRSQPNHSGTVSKPSKPSSKAKRPKKERLNAHPVPPHPSPQSGAASHSRPPPITSMSYDPSTPVTNEGNRSNEAFRTPENGGKQERVDSLEKALEALDTLTGYLQQQSGTRGTSVGSFATPQHFFILGELGGRLRRRLDLERG
ncbi:hypothetical protein CROQUDRAFT_451094 [Cronartium quercuum f. sp. fusiforme G11]|uniref:Uncharacterized protein n=1 Tax=Cronartium quercuum f. sp. fusiforme G11 TaxID=708437 RepID=A0A9P6NQL3_9BASI|nr:hypothetical protein CROQUDRAFT_451094 [Cronartium quercuum f. sp. fusiforme G11]